MNKEKTSQIKNACNLYPDFLTAEINKKLNDYISRYKHTPEVLKKAILYSINNGGKRLRPVLCLATAESLGKDYNIAMPSACAIELIHTYSLIHDDLPSIDNDDFRRGKPTCHRVFGEDIAILTGDALFAEAFNFILKYQDCPAEKKITLLEELIGAAGAEGMVAGQIIDVFYSGKKITKQMLNHMHNNKTGKLIVASVRCGAIIAQASGQYLKKLTDYSKCIGLAFQITDDVLDLEASLESSGKTTGKDALLKKNTFPSMYGLKKSKQIAEEKIEESINILESIDIESKLLVNIAKFIIKRQN